MVKKEKITKTPKKVRTNKPKEEKKLEVMNGDPTVVTEVEKQDEIEQEVLEVVSDPIDESGNVAEPLREKQEEVKDFTEEIEKKAFADTFKDTKITNRSDNMFGYSWNGMEMDTY